MSSPANPSPPPSSSDSSSLKSSGSGGISFPALVTGTAVLLAVFLVATLLPVLLVSGNRSHHKLIAELTVQRSEQMRGEIESAVDRQLFITRASANFSRRFGSPFASASNASHRLYASSFARFAAAPSPIDGGPSYVGCRFDDGHASWCNSLFASGFGVVQLDQVLPTPGQSEPRYNQLLHATGDELENHTLPVRLFMFNVSALRAFPAAVTSKIFKPLRFTTRTWPDGSRFKCEAQKLPDLSLATLWGKQVYSTYNRISVPNFDGGGKQTSFCSTSLRHSGFSLYLQRLLVGADQGARAFLFDSHAQLVIGLSHGVPFELSNTSVTPHPLPPRCLAFRTDVACFEDPLSYPLLAAVGWRNLSRPLPPGADVLLIDDLEVDGGGASSSSFFAVVTDLNTHVAASLQLRLFVFTPNDLLYAGVREATGVAVGVAVAIVVVTTIVGAVLLRSVSHVVSDLAERLAADPWQEQVDRRSSGGDSVLTSGGSSSGNVSGSVFGVIAEAVLCCSFEELEQVQEEHRNLRRVIEQLRGFMKQAVLLRRRPSRFYSGGSGSLSSSLPEAPALTACTDAADSAPAAAAAAATDDGKEAPQQQKEQQHQQLPANPSDVSGTSDLVENPPASAAAKPPRRRVQFVVREQVDGGGGGGSSDDLDDTEDDVDIRVRRDSSIGDEEEEAPGLWSMSSGVQRGKRNSRRQQQQQRLILRAHKSKSDYSFIAPSSFQLMSCIWVQFPVIAAMLQAIELGKFDVATNKNPDLSSSNNNVGDRRINLSQQLDEKSTALGDVIDVSRHIAARCANLIKKNPIVNMTEFLGDGMILSFYVRSLAAKSRVLTSVIRDSMIIASTLPKFLVSNCQCEFPSIVHWDASVADEWSSSPSSDAASPVAASPSSEAPSSPASAAALAISPPAPQVRKQRPIMVHENFMSVGVFAGVARLIGAGDEGENSSNSSRQFIFLTDVVGNAARICARAGSLGAVVRSFVDPGPPDRVAGQDEEGFLGGLHRASGDDVTSTSSSSGASSGAPPDVSAPLCIGGEDQPPTPGSSNWLSGASVFEADARFDGRRARRVRGSLPVVGDALPHHVAAQMPQQPVVRVVAHTVCLPRSLIPMMVGVPQESNNSNNNSRDPKPVFLQEPIADADSDCYLPRPVLLRLAVPPRRLAWCGDEDPAPAGGRDAEVDDGETRAFFALARCV